MNLLWSIYQEQLQKEELNNLKELHEYSVELENTLNQLSSDINEGRISWGELTKKGTNVFAQQVSNVSKDSFSNMEENFHEYAGLIYVEFRECSYFSHEKGSYTKLKMFCQTVKVAPKLSKEKFSEKKLLKCLESTYYRFHGLRRKLSESQNAVLS